MASVPAGTSQLHPVTFAVAHRCQLVGGSENSTNRSGPSSINATTSGLHPDSQEERDTSDTGHCRKRQADHSCRRKK